MCVVCVHLVICECRCAARAFRISMCVVCSWDLFNFHDHLHVCVCTCAIGVIRTDCVPMHLQDQAVQRSGGQIDSGIICQDRVTFGCVLPLHNFHSCVCFKDST